MARVFVFCVGGTGLRVMRSAIMLMAGGMDANGYEVVPIVIDPHINLPEKGKFNNLLEDYTRLHNILNTVNGQPTGNKLSTLRGFFETQLNDLDQINGQQATGANPFAQQMSFSQYLNLNKLKSNDVNQHLVNTLFAQSSLNNSLSVGFKGNPNVGTVALAEMIKDPGWFPAFCNAMQQGDRVFIISSIFGGTGASGYPLLEKKIKGAINNPTLSSAMVGAVTVLPYFSLNAPDNKSSDIDSASFITKAKAALAYYQNNVKSDYLYYVGEQSSKTTYDNDEVQQCDDAHFVELVAATALFDFLHKPDRDPNVPATPTQYMTRGIRDNEDSLTLSHLGKDDYADVVKAVTNMLLLRHLVKLMPHESHFPLSKTHGFNDQLYNDATYNELESFTDTFNTWYKELSSNHRAFTPVDIAALEGGKAMVGVIKGNSLDAKNESYYLLEMIKAGNRDKTPHQGTLLRDFMNYAQQAIVKYTSKI